ncbi:SLC13 family permease [Enterovirga sp.]|uniref:SLC13 family permease n=1 Tax=Enterovirga sp. TaxID=2026350 RepID=UPI002C527CD7|nr:SLC13 family permease [Enterovirga sp.]HMO29881.1 SLC13 family permease [Enterovirga sp.]
MSLDQALSFALIGGVILAFVWGRLPYDVVAVTGLICGVALGVVPADKAFLGFSDDIVVIVGCALVMSSAVARSGAVETLMRPILPHLTTTALQVPALVAGVLFASMVTKNVGALAIFMPIALQLARRTGVPASSFLMPMSFASLIGGIVTLVGTSPNVIVSRVRAELTGVPFGMFDYTPVGLAIAILGFLFLAVGWRLLPKRTGTASMEAAFRLDSYVAEVSLPDGHAAAGRRVRDLREMGGAGVEISSIVRERYRRMPAEPETELRSRDMLLLRGEPGDLERFVVQAGLLLAGRPDEESGKVTVIEGVVTPPSDLVGRTAAQLDLEGRYGMRILALSRSSEEIEQSLSATRFHAGDVVVLRGPTRSLPETLGLLRILPLAGRGIALGRNTRSWLPLAILIVAMALVAVNAVSVPIAFFGAVVVVLLTRCMTPTEAYAAIEWPVLILFAALIPISDAIGRTGGADLVAGWMMRGVQDFPPIVALGATLVLAMAVTPFLNNAATVLVMGPIAAKLAARLGMNPDPFLMATALGAACDFLTPIGHQCNTLVMGPGGYRFGDYARLGLPLSILVIVVGTPLIAFFWPLRAG